MEALLADAERGNPDVRPRFARGYLLAVTGEYERAARVMDDVVRREPAHVRAAAVLVVALRQSNPEAAEALQRHIREVAPPVPLP